MSHGFCQSLIPDRLDSYVNMPVDLNTGLAGPTIIYNRGMMNSTMASHREFVLLFEVFDESMSFLAETNLAMYNTSADVSASAMPAMLETNHAGNMSYWKPQLTNMPTVSLSSRQAPSFYTLNGYVLANSPSFDSMSLHPQSHVHSFLFLSCKTDLN